MLPEEATVPPETVNIFSSAPAMPRNSTTRPMACMMVSWYLCFSPLFKHKPTQPPAMTAAALTNGSYPWHILFPSFVKFIFMCPSLYYGLFRFTRAKKAPPCRILQIIQISGLLHGSAGENLHLTQRRAI